MAISLKEVAPILVKNKREEISKLETEVNEIVDCAPQKTATSEDKPEIILTSNKNRALNKGQRYYEVAKYQIDLTHTWRRFLQFWQYYEGTLEDAMARGVRIRQIVEYPKDTCRAQEFLNKKAFKNSLFEVKFVLGQGEILGL